MTDSMIELHVASIKEQLFCQRWNLWESGEANEFSYDYDQDVEFIVQQGKAIIHSQLGDSITIEVGSRVIIRAGVSGHWVIHSPIVNRYTYLK